MLAELAEGGQRTRVLGGDELAHLDAGETPVALARLGEGVADAPASAISFAIRSSARPEPYCSMQPRAPQPHGRPFGTTRMWPSSAAVPKPPRKRVSSCTMAPPTPVPMVIMTMSLTSRPAPKRNSAQPAALASFSMRIGRPMRSSSSARSGSFRHATFGV
ncbi:hypothetical protein GCM10025866_32830 [Naasia aerilata]|uniref:Uncharacterized protein n=1 Tax=Naasia aerilata TaxID=1162966 RepID=A0ABN6XQV1_9MICO|nr:hypothetical protein GCM10025866_32830 [Naasia aerilata]